MNPSKVFEHKGTVEEIRDSLVKVRMTVTEACGECSAKNICGSANSKERILEVQTTENNYSPGEEVYVVIAQSTGLRAVLIGYVLPVIVLILSLLIVLAFNLDEVLASLIAIGSVACYYLIVYFLKDKLKKTFTFTLRKPGA